MKYKKHEQPKSMKNSRRKFLASICALPVVAKNADKLLPDEIVFGEWADPLVQMWGGMHTEFKPAHVSFEVVTIAAKKVTTNIDGLSKELTATSRVIRELSQSMKESGISETMFQVEPAE